MKAHDNIENLVDYEVRIRFVEKALTNIDNKFNLIVVIYVSSIIIPVILHHYGMV